MLSLLLVIIISVSTIFVFKITTYPSRPPCVYKGVTHAGSYYNDILNRTSRAGNGNWNIEYFLAIHDGSLIEVKLYHLDERQPYSEANDIGWIRLTPSPECPYIDDIVDVSYEVDWLKVEPHYSGGYLDMESGLVLWEDDMPVIDGYGYQNDISKFRKLECQITFWLKDGRYVTEWADLSLHRLKNQMG